MMNHLTVETEDSFSSVLELAANNDVDGFKRSVDRFPLAIDEVGDWYGRKKVVEQRTPLMVAATYGSIDVLKLILSLSSDDVNRCCGSDKTTALHCAASGGSSNAVETVKILLLAGAQPNCVDAQGNRPGDLIVVPPKLSDVKATLEKLLGSSCATVMENNGGSLRVSTFNSNHLLFSSSSEEDLSPFSDSTSSPLDGKFQDIARTAAQEKKEYPVDPSLPDIKNSIYATDEFRMFSFKVRPCSRAYSHDWTECPFVHPGENARRRDPRKYHYSCVPCPDFKKGSCRRGDMCEYAHGVFECWLHPAQYRTRLCKDGTGCSRRVCFFAHTNEEMRPLHVSASSAVPSPRSSSSAIEMAAIGLMPTSPSSISAVMSPFTPPMSPSANGNSLSLINWPQQNVPALHLPGSGNLQSSRLKSSFSARDMPADDYSLMQEFESQQLVNDLCISRLVPSASNNNRASRQKVLSPSNLDELFSSEISSPRYNNSEQGTLFSPSLKSSNLNHFNHHHHQQQQNILSPVKIYSQKVLDQQLPGQSSFLQAPFGLSPPSRLSPRSVETMSPVYSSCPAAFGQREKHLLCLSSHDPGAGGAMVAVSSPGGSSFSKWASPSGKLDWGVDSEELGRLKLSSSEQHSAGEEPDLSWVHSLVKESPPEKPAATTPILVTAASKMDPAGSADGSSAQIDASHDPASLLGAWLDKMQLDQMVV